MTKKNALKDVKVVKEDTSLSTPDGAVASSMTESWIPCPWKWWIDYEKWDDEEDEE